MTAENHRVDQYQYELVQDSVEGSTRELMLLFLFDEKGELLCNIAFVPEGQQALQAVPSSSGHITVQLPVTQCDRVLDMLRNEKPVYFSWSPGSQSVRLSTNKEPVGEQELRKLFSFLYV